MNVLWLFPPMGEGFPNISQYRFFKRMPVRASIIYPYLAASGVTQIHNAGHNVQLIDCSTEEKTLPDITSKIEEAELIILEGRTPIINDIWTWIEVLKNLNSDVAVAVYGDHVSWDPKTTLNKGADFIIQGGDYDVSALRLVEDLSPKNPIIPHRTIYHYSQVNLDLLPFVDRELVDWRNYFEAWKKRDVFLWNMSQRGCFYHCVFCAWAKTFWDNKIRYRSIMNVAKETDQLIKRYGSLEILDDSDLFDFNWGLRWAKLLMNKFSLGKKDLLWSCQTHPSQITKMSIEDLKLMKLSGLSVVKLGIESSHDISLKTMKKASSRNLCEKAIKRLQEAQIMVHANLMIGFPWETKKMAMETLKWLKKLDPNQAQFSLVIPYPNTELWNMAEKNDWFIQDKLNWKLYDASFPMLRMEGLTGEEIVDLYVKMWSGFYLNPRYVWRHIKTIRHLEGIRNLWKGFRSVYFGHMRAVDKKRRV